MEGTAIDWVQWGVLGAVVLAMLTGQLVPGYIYKDTKAEKDRLQKASEEKVIPALLEYGNFVRESLKRAQ